MSHQPDKLPKKPTVRHKNVISSSEKNDKKSLFLTIHWVFRRILPRISPVLCSPASRPKKRPFNTKPLGDKHCLQRLALEGCWGSKVGQDPRCVSKLMALKNIRPTVSETGGETPNFETAPQILQIASKVAEKAPWSGKVENKTNSEWHRVQRKTHGCFQK